MEVYEILKKIRLLKGLTQQSVANSAGIDYKYYQRIEYGKSVPTVKMLENICVGLDISVMDVYLLEIEKEREISLLTVEINTLVTKMMKERIAVHVNREMLVDGCRSCIWYDGYIGSLHFDEFEMKLFAKGNLRGRLFWNGLEVQSFDTSDVYADLSRYVKNDEELKNIIEYLPYDEYILEEKEGKVLFVEENKWLVLTVINNQTGETDEIYLDTDNIIEGLDNETIFFDNIFGENKG